MAWGDPRGSCHSRSQAAVPPPRALKAPLQFLEAQCRGCSLGQPGRERAGILQGMQRGWGEGTSLVGHVLDAAFVPKDPVRWP